MRKKRHTSADALGVPFEELPEHAKARVPHGPYGPLGVNSPLRKAETFDEKKAARSRAARTRVRSGQGFEAELEIVHDLYFLERRAKVEHLRPPTVWKKGPNGWVLRLAPGGAPIDFMGTSAKLGAVAFDAKVCEHATYTHQPEQFHQLDRLRDHHDVGAIAFLLIASQQLGVAYIIGDPDAWAWLRQGKGLMLRSKLVDRDPRLAGRAEGFAHEWPVVWRLRELLVMQTTPLWDWLALLERDRAD